jgi:hypothetical protein
MLKASSNMSDFVYDPYGNCYNCNQTAIKRTDPH